MKNLKRRGEIAERKKKRHRNQMAESQVVNMVHETIIPKRTKTHKAYGVRSQMRKPIVGHFEVSSGNDLKHFALIEGIIEHSRDGISSHDYLQDVLLYKNSSALPYRGRMMELPGCAKAGRWSSKILCNGRDPGIELIIRTSLSDLTGTRILHRHEDHRFVDPLSMWMNDQEEQTLSTTNSPVHTVSRIDPSSNRRDDLLSKNIVNKNELKDRPIGLGSISLVVYDGFSSMEESQELSSEVASDMLSSCRDKLESETSPDMRGLISIPSDSGETRGSQFVCRFNLTDTDYFVLVGRNKDDCVVAIDVVFESTSIPPKPLSRFADHRIPLTAETREQHTNATRAAELPSPFRMLSHKREKHTSTTTVINAGSDTVIGHTEQGSMGQTACSPKKKSRIEVHSNSDMMDRIVQVSANSKSSKNRSSRKLLKQEMPRKQLSTCLVDANASHTFGQHKSQTRLSIDNTSEATVVVTPETSVNCRLASIPQVTGSKSTRIFPPQPCPSQTPFLHEKRDDTRVKFISPTPIASKKVSSFQISHSTSETSTPEEHQSHALSPRILFKNTRSPQIKVFNQTVEGLNPSTEYDTCEFENGDDEERIMVTWAGNLVNYKLAPPEKSEESKRGKSKLISILFFLLALFLFPVTVEDPTRHYYLKAFCKKTSTRIEHTWPVFLEDGIIETDIIGVNSGFGTEAASGMGGWLVGLNFFRKLN